MLNSLFTYKKFEQISQNYWFTFEPYAMKMEVIME